MHIQVDDWERRKKAAIALLSHCTLCPRRCGVNRLQGEAGFCGETVRFSGGHFRVQVAAAVLHTGEEPPLCGGAGTGNLFFVGCNSRCLFCQNWQISQGSGRDYPWLSMEAIAETMLSLQAAGASHLGLVTPSHISAALLEAFELAAEAGLHIPVIYNSNGYDSVDALALLEGIVSVYLPDFKYGDDALALRWSGLPHYTESVSAALREMSRQVGTSLRVNDDGLAERGLVVRHLVLPNGQAASKAVFEHLSNDLSMGVPVSLMAQYCPCFRAADKTGKAALLSRCITAAEYRQAVDEMEAAGLYNGRQQELASQKPCLPDFSRLKNPFSPA